MLETLRDEAFAELEDAYGLAVDVPRQLRALAGSDEDLAARALGDLYAGIFHQGSYFDSTAPAIPFLLEVAAAEVPLRRDVLLFLADMLPERAPSEPGFDPWVFRSRPGPPVYPAAAATIAAIERGRSVLEEALDAGNAEVRIAAAFALSRLPSSREAMEARRAIEQDGSVRAALVLALASGGAPPPEDEPHGSIAGDIAIVLAAKPPLSEAAAAAFERLLLAPVLERSELPFFDGSLTRFAALLLGAMGPAEPRAFEVAAAALERRFERGEALVELARPPSSRVCDEGEPARPSFDGYLAGEPLRALAGVMATLAFGERANDPRILRREEVDDRRRRVLALTRDRSIPVPVRCAPWITPRAMARFLAGGGPLDDEVEIDGVRAPIYVHLVPLEHGPVERVEALFTSLAQTLPAERLIELAADVLDDGYAAYTPHGWAQAVLTCLLPRVRTDVAGLRRYADSLAAERFPKPEQAAFALANEIAEGRAPEPHLDRLARAALCRPTETTRAWLAAFESPRREQLVASFGNMYLYRQYAPLCERTTLEAALLDAFMAPDCDWLVHEAEALVGSVADDASLEALVGHASGRRREILERVMQERSGSGVFTLELTDLKSSIRAVLHTQGRELASFVFSHPPMPEEIALLRPSLAAARRPVVVLSGDLDSTTEYRMQRLVGDIGMPIEVRAGGSSLRAGG